MNAKLLDIDSLLTTNPSAISVCHFSPSTVIQMYIHLYDNASIFLKVILVSSQSDNISLFNNGLQNRKKQLKGNRQSIVKLTFKYFLRSKTCGSTMNSSIRIHWF